jgi:nucleotide-binding universal stress UspA family protein
MYHSILVPLDGSTFAEGALPLAVSIARHAAASLELLYVHPPWEAAHPEVTLEYQGSLTNVNAEIKTRQRAYLDGVVTKLRRIYPGRIESAVRDGAIAATIQQHATERNIDLVVMTTHGRGALARIWLGSVADELVRHLSGPILLVRPGDSAGALDQGASLKHLLVPLDGSEMAERIIEPAVVLGTLMDAEYTLLRVVKPVMVAAGQAGGGFPSTGALVEAAGKVEAQLVKEAQEYLDRVATRLRAQGLRVQTWVTVNEQPASSILGAAGSRAIDLVAMETHGRRGLARLFLGSVADKVLRGSTLPLLVHRPVQPEVQTGRSVILL